MSALYGLLFTVVVLFARQEQTITSQPLNVVRIALPLLAYFAIMWFGALAIARRPHGRVGPLDGRPEASPPVIVTNRADSGNTGTEG